MCTVIIHVPATGGEPTRVLAVRDEDPARPWNPVGAWWPDTHPGVVGVRDVRAGGAWLAADDATRRLAVLLNREDRSARTDAEVTTRGAVVLDAVEGVPPADGVPTRGFNLVTVSPEGTMVTHWDGLELREQRLGPGTHMIAHDDVDDHATRRIEYWLDTFREHAPDAGAPAAGWETDWLAIVGRSNEFEPDDERAIIRDNRPLGFPTLSLLVCAATVSRAGVVVRYGELAEPGHWNALELR